MCKNTLKLNKKTIIIQRINEKEEYIQGKRWTTPHILTECILVKPRKSIWGQNMLISFVEFNKAFDSISNSKNS
jgi:hypothetical protein